MKMIFLILWKEEASIDSLAHDLKKMNLELWDL